MVEARSGIFRMKSVDQRYIDRIAGVVGISHGGHRLYDLTMTTHQFRCRRRLARLVPLMRRPRGRHLLGVKTYETAITFYGIRLA